MRKAKKSDSSFGSLVSRFLEKELYVVLALVLIAFVFRLKGITNSPTDWHAFRQADTASVTREYVKHGVDVLHPKFQDYSNIASGKDNPEGYRMVEFPIVNAFVASIVRAFPFFDLVVVSRSVSLILSLGTLVSIYYLGKYWSRKEVGVVSALVFAIMPYSAYYSRAILPEPAFLCFVTAAVLTFYLYLEKESWLWYLAAVVSFVLALLLKPFALFLGPLFGLLAFQKWGWKVVLRPELYVFVGLIFAPLYAWRNWIAHYPEGIPASDWLFNGDKIRFRPAWFRWLFLERITKLMLGWFGMIFVVFSVFEMQTSLQKWWSEVKKSSSGMSHLFTVLKNFFTGEQGSWRYAVWWICVLIYFSVIATGNVRHDYYQVFILPIVCLSVGRGVVWLYEQSGVPKQLAVAVVLVSLLGSAYFTEQYVGGYYSTRSDWEKAGQAADRLLPADAKVIAPAFGDTAFLFQTNRTGWPIGIWVEDFIKKGAQYYVTTAYDDEARDLEKKYQTVEKTDDYLILKLTPKQ